MRHQVHRGAIQFLALLHPLAAAAVVKKIQTELLVVLVEEQVAEQQHRDQAVREILHQLHHRKETQAAVHHQAPIVVLVADRLQLEAQEQTQQQVAQVHLILLLVQPLLMQLVVV
jgi:hypothetical protein